MQNPRQCYDTNFAKEEYCCGATLHRGYYHPSPVYDLIVGNTKRGKLCPSRTAQVTNRFLFDHYDRLVRVETFHRERISTVEYLFYENQKVQGITIDSNGYLASVSEEQHEDGKIVYYAIARYYYSDGKYTCFDYHQEEFTYDAHGLFRCQFINFTPQSGYLIDRAYNFERKNGYLIAYFPESHDGLPVVQEKYMIKRKRKA